MVLMVSFTGLQVERRRADERRELRETAAAQKRIIRELRGQNKSRFLEMALRVNGCG